MFKWRVPTHFHHHNFSRDPLRRDGPSENLHENQGFALRNLLRHHCFAFKRLRAEEKRSLFNIEEVGNLVLVIFRLKSLGEFWTLFWAPNRWDVQCSICNVNMAKQAYQRCRNLLFLYLVDVL